MAGTTDKRMIVGLDIGTSKVVAVVGEVDGEGVSETRGGFYGAGVSRTNHVFDWPESV